MNRDRENVGHENSTNISGHRYSWDPREKKMGGKSTSSLQTLKGETFGVLSFKWPLESCKKLTIETLNQKYSSNQLLLLVF